MIHPFKALGIAHGVREIVGQQFQGFVHLPGIDHAAARPLIPGMGGEITDHRHLGAVLQRENILVVFEKYDALLRGFPCGIVLSFFVHALCLWLFSQHHIQQFLHPLVDDFLVDFSILHSPQQLAGAIVPGGGHFQIHPCPTPLDKIIAAAPVRDHHAVKIPFPAEDIIQMSVFIGIGAVDLVVGGHNGFRLSFLDGDFKIRQV